MIQIISIYKFTTIELIANLFERYFSNYLE